MTPATVPDDARPTTGRPTDSPSPGAEAVDWTDEAAFERAEEARTVEPGDDTPADDLRATFPAEADEADVLDQLMDAGGDDEDDLPRTVES